MPERFAIYYAPAVTDPMWRSACRWLGRDAATGEKVNGVTGLDPQRRLALTQSARRYGFHATLKAPMALAEGQDFAGLAAALDSFARQHRPIPLGPIVLEEIAGFLALMPEEQSGHVTEFARDCVIAFEPFRAPMTPREREKRLAGGQLTPRQIELLDGFGYPYVLEEFRFHMTLTDQLKEPDRSDLRQAAREWFDPYIGRDLMIDRLVIYRENQPGMPFDRLEDFELTGRD